MAPQTCRPAVVPRLALHSAATSRSSPRSPGHSSPVQPQARTLGIQCARSSPRLFSGVPKSGSEPRVSPRFGRASQPELAAGRNKQARMRQAKAEAAHISRRRESISGNTSARCEDPRMNQSSRSTCERNRPNPLLSGGGSNTQGSLCYRSPSFSQLGESSIDESVQSAFEAVLEERVSYMSLFGNEDSDLEDASFGSYSNKVTELCQRAESLVRDLSSDLDACASKSDATPGTALSQQSVEIIARMPSACTMLDVDDPSTWPGSAPCDDRDTLFAELGASVTPLPTPPLSPTDALIQTEQWHKISSAAAEDVQPLRPASSCCALELGDIVTAFGPPTAAPSACEVSVQLPSQRLLGEEDPSSWPDLQPWLRSMCPTAQAAAGAHEVLHPKASELQLSDLQFRISRLELQISQINSVDEKPSVSQEVAELRRHVESAQAELQATRLEAQETQEQLRRLLQYAGTGISEVPHAGSHSVASDVIGLGVPSGRVFRSSSGSSQESQFQKLQQSATPQPSVPTRSPVQMPRARSLDSGTRRRFYPAPTSRQIASQQCLPGRADQEKLAPKRKSSSPPQPGPHTIDVPVRMCTPQQLIRMAKHRPLWLRKVGDAAPRSTSEKGASPHQCARFLKAEPRA